MHDHLVLLLGYIDPGAGSLIFQTIAAAAIAGLLTITRVKQALIFGLSWPRRWIDRFNTRKRP